MVLNHCRYSLFDVRLKMKNKKIILVIVLEIIAYLLYGHVSIVRRTIDRLLLPSAYKEYPYLYENKAESKKYRITNILDGSSYEGVSYYSGTKEFIIEVADADYIRYEMGWKTLWKISKEGKVLDSLNTTNYMHSVGVYLDSTTYVDWAYSGDKSAKKDHSIINFDSIPKVDFDACANTAETFACGSDYDNETTNLYLKIENEWLLFKSK